jgi:antitoxin PrlF
MIRSRLSSKGRTTIPRGVRAALGLLDGDTLEYVVVGREIILRKAGAPFLEDPVAGFDEWDSEADRRSFSDL